MRNISLFLCISMMSYASFGMEVTLDKKATLALSTLLSTPQFQSKFREAQVSCQPLNMKMTISDESVTLNSEKLIGVLVQMWCKDGTQKYVLGRYSTNTGKVVQ